MSTHGYTMVWLNFRGCIKTIYEYIYSLWNESFLLYCMRYLFVLRSFYTLHNKHHTCFGPRKQDNNMLHNENWCWDDLFYINIMLHCSLTGPLVTSTICFLFGLMEGLANEGLDEFFLSHVVESMRSYGPSFNDCVLGFGNFF